jgi:mono/diheme cytochrome c family protein
MKKNVIICSILWAFCLVVALPGLVFAQDLDTHVGNLTGRADVGKQLYRRYCIGCHSPNGDGKGENAPYVTGWLGDPLPRNFVLGIFKCRSTPTGSLPLDSDLFDTIGRGVDTTFMPPWNGLTPQQRVDLIAYLKTFSQRFKDEKPDKPIVIPPETPGTAESVARGKVLYQTTLKCVECHGTTGVGDGPSAATLRDNLGNPIKPYDFVNGSRFKCGTTDQDLYRIFMTGLDGTPMPSWADFMDANQAWDLVHYLRTLQLNYHAPHTPKENAKPKEQKGE